MKNMKNEIQKTHYINGQNMCEIPYKNGKIHGLRKWWHSNGQLSSETPFKNNLQHGATIKFEY